MLIRPYESADLDAVIDIFRSNIPKYFGPEEEPDLRSFLNDCRSHEYLVAQVADGVIGAGGVALNKDKTVSLCWGMLRSDFIGRGLGRTLTEFRIKKAREKFGSLPLVISTSQHTQGFYEKFGSVMTEHTPDGYGPGIDICKMGLDV